MNTTIARYPNSERLLNDTYVTPNKCDAADIGIAPEQPSSQPAAEQHVMRQHGSILLNLSKL